MLRRVIILVLLATIAGCGKEKALLQSGIPLIKTRTENNLVETYHYDSLNRVTRIEYSSTLNPASYFHTFTYYKDTLFEYHSDDLWSFIIDTLPNGAVIYRQYNLTHILNSHNLYEGQNANSVFPFIIVGGEEVFNYDNNDFINVYEFGATDAAESDTFMNDGRNIIRSWGTSGGLAGQIIFHSDFSYTQKINTIGNKNFGLTYLGTGMSYTTNSSRNLVRQKISKLENLTFPDISSIDTTDYYYEFDLQGRVIQRTEDFKTTSRIWRDYKTITTYTYY